uniref:Secreted protein n=1 Tax=Eutreptiella gymnastica TaxID=73025 RepID=A0A7S4CZ94_9EUGL
MMAVVWEGGLHALLSLASTHMMLHSATIECLLYAVPIPKQSIFRYNILSMCATRLGMNISGVQTTPCIVSHFCCHFQWWILPLMSYFLLCYISDAVPSMKQMQGLGGNVPPCMEHLVHLLMWCCQLSTGTSSCQRCCWSTAGGRYMPTLRCMSSCSLLVAVSCGNFGHHPFACLQLNFGNHTHATTGLK